MSDRSQLTGWEIVRRAEALHPEWTLEQHVAHLSEDEGYRPWPGSEISSSV